MTSQEILKLIKRYIGVDVGNLADFSHSSLIDFYPEHCGLEVDVKPFSGTKRDKFEAILRASQPDAQAKIIRGVLEKCPPVAGHPLRTQELYDEFVGIALRLEGMPGVSTPTLAHKSETVEKALNDAETLIKTTGAASGVDRIHTAIHGYVKAVCDTRSITYASDATILALFKLILAQHPAFTKSGAKADEIAKVCRSMFSAMDALNPIRNGASLAHPNEVLLEPPEAMLVINATRTMLHYIDAKLAG